MRPDSRTRLHGRAATRLPELGAAHVTILSVVERGTTGMLISEIVLRSDLRYSTVLFALNDLTRWGYLQRTLYASTHGARYTYRRAGLRRLPTSA